MRKSKYFDSEPERIKKAGKNGSWYNVLSRIVDDDAPKLWSLADLEPDKSPEVLSEQLAIHFTEITNQAKALELKEVPKSYVPNELFPQLMEENVAKRIKDYKKPNSSVPGDIPNSLVNPIAHILAIPLTVIYDNCPAGTKWPAIWKREVVIAIPKTQTPKDFNDLRPISMSPLWSKILESIVAEATLKETKDNWKSNQHGGIRARLPTMCWWRRGTEFSGH